MTPPSRWRTGTLAVAGTIPVRSVNAAATLVRSEGHHPAGYRPAVPTRAYESGSDGGSRHAVPVRRPCPKPRPPPGAKASRESPCPGRAHHRLTGPGVKGACGVAARALRAPMTPAAGSRDRAAIQDMRPDRHAPAPSPEPPRTGQTRHGPGAELQKLDRPLHMRSGAVSSGVLQVFCPCFGRSRACRTGPRACCSAWGRGLPCSPAAADPGERPGAGQGPGAARPAKPAPSGVLDAAGREPIIGRREQDWTPSPRAVHP